MRLKYGCNPHQEHAEAIPIDGDGPFTVLAGEPGYINLLDALNGWQLVAEARAALGLPAAASFKHVSPAGAAVAVELPEDLALAYEVHGRELSPAAVAYVRARGADPKSSFGDFVALSDPVDLATARFLRGVVSDGIVAPDYEPEALEVLRAKKKGAFLVLRANPSFEPPPREAREIFGLRLVQDRNGEPVTDRHLEDVRCGTLDDAARRDLLLGLITLKYTQSNSVGFATGGQMIGIGAGQQSRIDCTKLAGAKADTWHCMRHPGVIGLRFREGIGRQERINWRIRFIEADMAPDERTRFESALSEPAPRVDEAEWRDWIRDELRDVRMVSDGFLPFRDNVDAAARHGVSAIAQPGGSARDAEVEAACRELGITLVHTGLRLFHH